MKNPESSVLVIVFVIVSSYISETHGRKQAQRLTHFCKSKLELSMDSSPFWVNQQVHQANIFPQEGLKERDRIEKLPGQPVVEFSQYGGYVTVDTSAGRAMYYYFVEAQKDKDSAPLLLWLNGGPGCSSLAFGAMQELGPFRVHSDGKTLFRNHYSWNNVANVLFLETPAGVGFSYSNTTSDYHESGDRKTAADNFVFLINWLERFPQYKGREFYMSGESYAGHYLPQLAHTILYHNNKANRTIINLKGTMIGNAAIDDEIDARGMFEYFQSHALISDESANQILKYCDFSPNATTQSDQCNAATHEAKENTQHLDLYNIYAPLCTNTSITTRPKKACIMNFDPCSEYYVHAYLNRPEVQEAMHANVTKLDHDWETCSDIIGKWKDSPSTIFPLLRELMANGLRVWIFSGDADGRVPVTSTKNSLYKMELPVKTSWRAWYLPGEVGGYTREYEGDLTFATVRGAGHQVPSYQPKRALSLVTHFLGGSPLPNTSGET